jgi:hypothetical protein
MERPKLHHSSSNNHILIKVSRLNLTPSLTLILETTLTGSRPLKPFTPRRLYQPKSDIPQNTFANLITLLAIVMSHCLPTNITPVTTIMHSLLTAETAWINLDECRSQIILSMNARPLSMMRSAVGPQICRYPISQ